MRKILAVAVLMLFSALSLRAQTQTTTITIVAPSSLGIITPTPSHFYQNLAAPISFASSTSGFNSTCTATAGTVALPVTYSATTQALAATLTAAMTNITVGSTLTITITCTPASLTMNNPAVLPNAPVGTPYSVSLQTVTGLTGGVPPYTWTLSAGSLPAGLALSSSGNVTGTPSGVGSSTFGFTVTDSSGMALNYDQKWTVFDFSPSFRAWSVASRVHS
jgi:large repetitive protein